MRILILGAAGFIGSHLTRYAIKQNHTVVALCRSGVIPGFTGSVFVWELGESIPSEALEEIDCAIHLAHDFDGSAGAKLTQESTLVHMAQIRATGVTKQIFFSSYSAGKHATSLYGRTKLAIEQEINKLPDITIIRPGLVLGHGGIYGRIHNYAQRLPIIPLPGGGHGKVPVITLKRLCHETLKLTLFSSPPVEANLFEIKFRSLRQLVIEAAAEIGRRPWVLPIPSKLIIVGLKVATILHLPLPVSADNLIGFLANQQANHFSTLQDE